jgi:hypothetical protein
VVRKVSRKWEKIPVTLKKKVAGSTRHATGSVVVNLSEREEETLGGNR